MHLDSFLVTNENSLCGPGLVEAGCVIRLCKGVEGCGWSAVQSKR